MNDPASDHLLREAFAEVEALLDMAADERARALEDLSRSRAPLRPLVDTLLRAAEAATRSSFLGGVAVVPDAPTAASSSLRAGDRLGNYQVELALGKGGMGEVWRARRTDGAYDAAIALKVLHTYLAMGSLRERFVREGRILGALSHINIARLLDAGVSAQGQLYLVIELVDGQHIDEWCDVRGLDLDARIKLFIQICEAVAYAHAHMVVHRDLKPANILVTNEGTIKLLDFGIAKLVSGDSVEASSDDQTRLGERALTPDYAAPEQLRGEPISAATDVYAMGVLLYQLVSGHKPYVTANRSLLQLESDITRGGLLLPSEALSVANTPLHGRAGNPRELRRLLRGELDAIVSKALRPKAEDRYPDARGLRDDLQRYLAHEPVAARIGARAYVLRLFLRRNWKAISVASVLVLVLLSGTAAVAWQAHMARIEAAKALAVKSFLLDIFQQNSMQNPDVEKARNTTAQQLLDIGGAKILTSLHDQPEVRDELLATIGDLYDQMELFDKSTELTRARLVGVGSMGRGASSELADAEVNLGRALHMSGAFMEADAVLRQSLRTMNKIKDMSSARRAHALLELGRIDARTQPLDYPETVDFLQRAVAMYDQCCLADGDRVGSLQTLARVFERRGDYPAAESGYRKAIALIASTNPNGETPISTGRAYDDLGSFLLIRHRYAEAEDDLHIAGELLTKTEGPLAFEVNTNKGYQAQALLAMNQPVAGDALANAALQTFERVAGPDKIDYTVTARAVVIGIELQRGALAAASMHLEENRAAFARASQTDAASCSPRCALSSSQWAELSTAEGRYAEAAAAVELAQATLRRFHSEKTEFYAKLQVQRAGLDLLDGHRERALKTLREVIAAFPAGSKELPEPYVLANLSTASALLASDPAEAQSVAADLLKRLLALPDHEYFAEWEAHAQRLLGLALTAKCNPAEAEAPLRRALQLRQSIDVPQSPWLADARVDLALTLMETEQRTDTDQRAEIVPLLDQAMRADQQAPALATHYRERLQLAQERERRISKRGALRRGAIEDGASANCANTAPRGQAKEPGL